MSTEPTTVVADSHIAPSDLFRLNPEANVLQRDKVNEALELIADTEVGQRLFANIRDSLKELAEHQNPELPQTVLINVRDWEQSQAIWGTNSFILNLQYTGNR